MKMKTENILVPIFIAALEGTAEVFSVYQEGEPRLNGVKNRTLLKRGEELH